MTAAPGARARPARRIGRGLRTGPCTAVLAIVAVNAGGCTPDAPSGRELVLASTTSLYDSGLLDVLLPAFAAVHPDIRVRLVAVGSGHALELGRRGDADVLLVHSPTDEIEFMRAGYGSSRVTVMRSDFIIIGPATDPAGVRDAPDATDVMRRIAAAGARFVSRGDDSGTHRKEAELWAAAGLGGTHGEAPANRIEAGQGMGETLAIASERGAYTLTDRGTFSTVSGNLRLVRLFSGDPALLNEYSVITVAESRRPADAATFAGWLASDEAAAVISGFAADETGAPVFIPASAAGPPVPATPAGR
ncbi:MAG TPA: substrate-binding domain-containing protein [Longimicrobiales bacterium]|nr:substrate-binding domain-containing protein [Longimicrobiales bacterium]